MPERCRLRRGRGVKEDTPHWTRASGVYVCEYLRYSNDGTVLQDPVKELSYCVSELNDA